MLTKDVSAGGTITLTEDEAAHERLKFSGSPASGLSVVVPGGAGIGWCRTFWNSSGQQIIVKGSAGDSGVAVPTARAYQILSDGSNCVRVE
jgi:hypothetical protein